MSVLQIIILISLIIFLSLVILLIVVWKRNKALRNVILLACIMTALFQIGINFPFTSIYCAMVLELFTILLYCAIFPVFAKKSLKETKDLRIIAQYILPTLVVYLFLNGFFYFLIYVIEPNERSLQFFNTFQNIHNTVGLGFIVNAIFKYFDRINEVKKEGHNTILKVAQGNKTLIYELKQVIENDDTAQK